jgi:hypothetical protein
VYMIGVHGVWMGYGGENWVWFAYGRDNWIDMQIESYIPRSCSTALLEQHRCV